MESLLKNKSVDLIISEVSKELRLSTDLKGCGIFLYLLKAVIENRNAIYNLSRLYGDAAQLFEVKKDSISAMVSYAIEKSWEEIEPEIAVKIFGRYNKDLCPANKKYLASVSEYIRLKIEE